MLIIILFSAAAYVSRILLYTIKEKNPFSILSFMPFFDKTQRCLPHEMLNDKEERLVEALMERMIPFADDEDTKLCYTLF